MRPYSLFFKLTALTLFISVLPVFAAAQRSLRCPKPKKERKYNEPRILNYMDVHVFGTLPFAYRHKGDIKDPYFRGATSLGWGGNFQNHLVLSDKVELLVDIMGVLNQQGLAFRYEEGGLKVSDRHLTASSQYRLSAGASYNLSDRFSIAIAPSIVYNTVIGYTSSGSSSANGNMSSNIDVAWNDTDQYPENWYAGASIYARLNISKKFFASFMTAIDFDPSSPSSGTVTVISNGVLEQHTVHRNPYLMFVGIGLGVRVYQVNRGGY